MPASGGTARRSCTRTIATLIMSAALPCTVLLMALRSSAARAYNGCMATKTCKAVRASGCVVHAPCPSRALVGTPPARVCSMRSGRGMQPGSCFNTQRCINHYHHPVTHVAVGRVHVVQPASPARQRLDVALLLCALQCPAAWQDVCVGRNPCQARSHELWLASSCQQLSPATKDYHSAAPPCHKHGTLPPASCCMALHSLCAPCHNTRQGVEEGL